MSNIKTENDLFMTYTDFELVAGIYFPADLVLGCIVQTYTNIEHPLSLKEVDAKRKALTFEDVAGNSLVFNKMSVNSSPYREGVYLQATTNAEISSPNPNEKQEELNVYCGCMCATFDLDAWFNCLPKSKPIKVKDNSLIIHPSCCFGGSAPSLNKSNKLDGYTTIDFGDAYFNSDGVLILPDKAKSLGYDTAVYADDNEVRAPRLEEIRVGKYTLKGASVNFILTHPVEDTYGFYDTSLKLIAEDGQLTFTSYEE